jgi:hypothetical protein
MLPVGPVIRWLITHEDEPALKEHLAALVDQELRAHDGPVDRLGLISFWERALPGAPIGAADLERQLPEPVLDEVLEEVLQVALGAVRPGRFSGLAGLLALPASARPAAASARPAASRPRPRWWRRWVAR